MDSFIYNQKQIGNPAFQAFFHCKKRKGIWENTNETDSIINVDAVLSKETRRELNQNFAVLHGEKKLYFRDTSLFNNRNKGIVITDTAIHYIKDNLEDLTIVLWNAIRSVKDDEDNFILITHKDDVINIPKDAIIKGYYFLDDEKQLKSTKKVLYMFQTMADSMPYTKPLDYLRILRDATYSSAQSKEIICGHMLQSVLEYDVFKLQTMQDMQPYLQVVQKFELFKQQINKRFGNINENIRNATEQIQNGCRGMVMKNLSNARQGGQFDGNGFLLAVAIYAMSEIYENIRENALEQKQEICLRNCQRMQEEWFEDNFNHFADKLNLYNKQIDNMNTFYYNMLKKIVSQNDMNYVLYDTSLGCFALHCKLIYAQQWTACMLQSLISISKQKQNDTQFLTMEQIIQNEYRKLMDRFSENAVNSKQGLTPVFILLNQ